MLLYGVAIIMKFCITYFFNLAGIVWGESCSSCGHECESSCGTRHFRTCCFNYLKKRSQLSEPFPLTMSPRMKLDLWLAKSRNNPIYLRSLLDSQLRDNAVVEQAVDK